MTRFVLDASVAVKWLIAEEGSDLADGLLETDHELHAPRLLASEASNALQRRAERGALAPLMASALASLIPRLPLQWSDDELLSGDATRLAVGLGWPIYDCMYLALAHSLDAQLITADIRFAEMLATTEHGETVVALSDFAGAPP